MRPATRCITRPLFEVSRNLMHLGVQKYIKNVADSVSNRSLAIATDRAVKPQFRYKYRNQSATASIEKYF